MARVFVCAVAVVQSFVLLGSGASIETAESIARTVLDALEAQATARTDRNTRHDILFSGISRYDAETVKHKIDNVLTAARVDGATVSEWKWGGIARSPHTYVLVDGVQMQLIYSEDTGYVSIWIGKPAPTCEDPTPYVELHVLVIGEESPFYRELPKRARIDGLVKVGVHVDPDTGKLTLCVRSVSRKYLGFEWAAFEAVEQELNSRDLSLAQPTFEVRFQLTSERQDESTSMNDRGHR